MKQKYKMTIEVDYEVDTTVVTTGSSAELETTIFKTRTVEMLLSFFTTLSDKQVKVTVIDPNDPPKPYDEIDFDTQACLRHPILEFFGYWHLPDHMKGVSKECARLAKFMLNNTRDCAEKSAGFRKLLEAKDCFVRASK